MCLSMFPLRVRRFQVFFYFISGIFFKRDCSLFQAEYEMVIVLHLQHMLFYFSEQIALPHQDAGLPIGSHFGFSDRKNGK